MFPPPFRYCILISGLLLIYITPVQATHIVGGELNYTCLGDNEYEITLTVYRDCFNGDPNAWFDDPASIGIFDANNDLVTELGNGGQLLIDFPVNEDDTIMQDLNDPCFDIPPNVCVHTYTYKDTLILPFRQGGYTLAYQRCCRNRTILNIQDPLETGATYLVRLSEETLRQCNSNAKFKDWPPIYICVDRPIDFDHGAIDPDGDSLVYKLCTPLEGANQIRPRPQPPNNPPYDTVRWITPPYSKDNMLGGVPLQIDSETGFLTGIPNTIGQFVVGVCVEEYRDGELISVTRRDFQYNVGECRGTVAAFFSADFYCENEAIEILNESENSDKYEWTLEAPGFQDRTSTAVNPEFRNIPDGIYDISLIAIDSSTGCADSAQAEFEVVRPPIDPEFEVSISNCENEDSLMINVFNQSVVTDTGEVDTNWYQYIGDSLINQDPPFIFPQDDSVLIVLELISSIGCMARDSLYLDSAYFEISLADSLEICRGNSVALNPNAVQGDSYVWSPGIYLDDSLKVNPIAMPEDSILYTVSVSRPGKCDYQDSIYIAVLESAEIVSLSRLEDSVMILETNTVFYEVVNEDSIIWDPYDIIVNEFSGSVDVFLDETRNLTLIAQKDNGCSDTANILLPIIRPPCEEPYIFIPNAFSPNGDNVNDEFRVRGKFLETLEGFVYNRWGEKVFTFNDPSDAWDGFYDGKPAPIDGYGYYFQFRCTPDGPVHERKGNISLIR